MGDGGQKPVREPPWVQEAGRQGTARPWEPGHVRSQFVRLAYRFLWNWDDAEDAVQDAFALAYARCRQLKDQSKWWSWVAQIVVNRCLLEQRRRMREERHYKVCARRPDSDTGYLQGLEKSELNDILTSAIAELPERQRTAIVLRDLEGLAYRLIADVMDISESTARVHVRSGREFLRKVILKRYPEWAENA